MASSAISSVIIGITGPTGPTGPRGATGAIGTGIGLTGNTGSTGIFITEILKGPNLTQFLKSDGTGFVIFNTIGPTGYTGTMYGENLGTGLTLYSSINGFTLSVRGLTFTNNLTAEVTGGTILITPLDVYYGVTVSNEITSGRVVYSKTSSVIDSTGIQLGKTYDNFFFSNVSGITPGSIPVYAEMQGNMINVPSESNNLILGLTLGSVYHIKTPLGLSGFTLDSSLYGSNELLSFTFFVEGNGFTQFPSNVYFENSPYSSVFGCGTNIMNLLTYDKGTNWFATIIDRGYGVDGCSAQDSIGSCCYVGPSGERECVEYVTEYFCKTKPSGIFNSMTPCDPTCREVGICCSSGKCVEGVSKQECEYFLGKYYKGISCAPYEQNGDNSQRLCYSNSEPAYSCCTGTSCIDEVTATICLNYYKGTPVSGKCCDVSCITFKPISGACCVEGGSPSCSVTSPEECRNANGIFYGDGTVCEQVNCCFDVIERGSCCSADGCLVNFTRDQCNLVDGVWFATMSECTPFCTSGVGFCCLFGSCEPGYLREECESIDPDAKWYSTAGCNGECS